MKKFTDPGVEKVELLDAMTISQEAISWQPAAAATPIETINQFKSS